MRKKVLILGHTGKMGLALSKAFAHDYDAAGRNSMNFDAAKPDTVKDIIARMHPDIVINAVASLGIDHCEQEPHKALAVNTLFPRALAELSQEKKFLLIHFSTDAVFNDEKGTYYTEIDRPVPLNMYGFTKYGGDCFVQAIAEKYYIFRISTLFGEAVKETQFMEKMLAKVKAGAKSLKISNDIFLSPTYSRDIAEEAKRIVESRLPFGLYHIANDGKTSLYGLMKEMVRILGLEVNIEVASYRDFPSVGRKNICTPLKSDKISALRPWKKALKDYCNIIKNDIKVSVKG